jgi:hypothetical protein
MPTRWPAPDKGHRLALAGGSPYFCYFMLLSLSFRPTEHAGIPPSQGYHSVSVTPHFSPSRGILSTTSLSTATAVVEFEASVFEPAQKLRHSQEIRESR